MNRAGITRPFFTILAATVCLVLLAAPALAGRDVRLEILPRSVKAATGARIQFTAIAYTAQGLVHSPTNVSWSVVGSGRINGAGLLTVGSGGRDVTVRARSGNLRAEARIQVVAAADDRIVRIVVSPPSASLAQGRTATFSAQAYDRYNRPVSFRPQWQVSGGGTIDSQGRFKATRSGTVRVTVRDPASGRTASATVTVTAGSGGESQARPARLVISPDRTSLQPSQTTRFTARAYDRSNRPMAATFEWQTNGGTIDQRGVFKAGSRSGAYQVWAVHRSSGLRGTASVTISSSGGGRQPAAGQARLVIKSWDVGGGSLVKSKAKIKVQTLGAEAALVKLFSVSPQGKYSQIGAQSCRDGQTVYFQAGYSRSATRYLEIRLYNRGGRIIARTRKAAR